MAHLLSLLNHSMEIDCIDRLGRRGIRSSPPAGTKTAATHLTSILLATSAITLLLWDLWQEECGPSPRKLAATIPPFAGGI